MARIEGFADAPNEAVLMRRIQAALKRHYPGFMWLIETRDGMVSVTCLTLHGRYGFWLHESQIDPTCRSVIMAAGEILERFGQRRGRYNVDDHMNARRNFAGEMIPDE